MQIANTAGVCKKCKKCKIFTIHTQLGGNKESFFTIWTARGFPDLLRKIASAIFTNLRELGVSGMPPVHPGSISFRHCRLMAGSVEHAYSHGLLGDPPDVRQRWL